MRQNKGFTLTEILLAVMIVGLIGVALASLTTTATREATGGRSRIMLRNSLSLALRQIRQDIHESSQVLYVRGVIDTSTTGTIPLLVLGKNMRISDGGRIMSTPGLQYESKYVAYCFSRGDVKKLSNGANVLPANATDGGVIYRREVAGQPASLSQVCRSTYRKALLHNVKFIPPSTEELNNYPVPFFGLKDYTNARRTDALNFITVPSGYTRVAYTDGDIASRLYIHLVVELPISPVVNEVAEEMFALPNGFKPIATGD